AAPAAPPPAAAISCPTDTVSTSAFRFRTEPPGITDADEDDDDEAVCKPTAELPGPLAAPPLVLLWLLFAAAASAAVNIPEEAVEYGRNREPEAINDILADEGNNEDGVRSMAAEAVGSRTRNGEN